MAIWAVALAGATAAVFAVMMVLQRSLYVCAICLLVVLFQIAVFFFLAGAPILAFLQIMIYAGAVMVLIVVMIMAAPLAERDVWSKLSVPRPLAAAGILIPLIEIGVLIWRGASPGGALGRAYAVQAQLGTVLFKSYGLATEAVTLLMFLAGLAILDRRPAR